MFPTQKITGKQLSAARSLLGLKQEELAEAADVNRITLVKIENEQAQPHLKTMERIRAVLEMRGIEFTNGDGIGVRLRYKSSGDTKPTAP